MSTIKIATIALLASALLIGACGRRGAPEAPPGDKEEQQEKGFILDPLVKSRS